MNKKSLLSFVYVLFGLLAVTSSALEGHAVGFAAGLVVLGVGVWIVRTRYG